MLKIALREYRPANALRLIDENDPGIFEMMDGKTSLMYAMEHLGREVVISKLVEKGVDVNIPNENGIFAATSGIFTEALPEISRRSSQEAKDQSLVESLKTMIHFKQGFLQFPRAIKTLLEHGANPLTINESRTALDYAMELGTSTGIWYYHAIMSRVMILNIILAGYSRVGRSTPRLPKELIRLLAQFL